MTSKISGPCPHRDCNHYFIGVSLEQVGEHFREHLNFHAPPQFVGVAAARLMEYRQKEDPARPDSEFA